MQGLFNCIAWKNGGFPGGASGEEPPANAGEEGDSSSIPWVRKIPWMQSMGMQRVGHDWACMYAHTYMQLKITHHCKSYSQWRAYITLW